MTRASAGLRAAAACAALLALSALAACNRVGVRTSDAPEAPSALLVTIDTLRADHVGAWGAPPGRTPTLDALAARGVVFERAFAPTPLTLPSHATILTGRLPPAHGVRHNGLYRLDAELPRLPQPFRAIGHATAAFVGAAVLAPRYGLEPGFQVYDAASGARRAAATGFPERDATAVTDAALAWLAAHDGPFFLWVHYYDPHAAYRAPPAFAARFPDDPYAAEIAYADAELGRLLGALQAEGRLAGTLVAVTADHGESLGEHGEATHGYTLYDATQHVPWILAGPGVPPGRRVDALVSSADLAPTLWSRAGLPVPPGLDGRDLSPWIDAGPDASAPPDDYVAYAETWATRLDHGWAPLHAARSRRHLFVDAPRPELYDVEADPAQRHDLLASGARSPDDVPEPLVRTVARARAEATQAEAVELDPHTRAQLQALGYALPSETPEATGLDPKDGLPLVQRFVMAKSLLADDRVAEAAREARALREALPQSAQLEELLTLVALRQGDRRAAVRHAERAVELVPVSARHHVILGLARVAAGERAEAVEAFERAAALDPRSAEAQAGLMWRAAAGGSLEDAEEAAARALALAPSTPALVLRVADTWDELDRYDRALALYRRALELDPSLRAAHLGVAVNTIRLGDLEEARRHLELAGPAADTLPARMRVAIAYAGRGASAEAEAILRGILRERPDFAGARRVLALLLERTGRADEARALRAADAS